MFVLYFCICFPYSDKSRVQGVSSRNNVREGTGSEVATTSTRVENSETWLHGKLICVLFFTRILQIDTVLTIALNPNSGTDLLR